MSVRTRAISTAQARTEARALSISDADYKRCVEHIFCYPENGEALPDIPEIRYQDFDVAGARFWYSKTVYRQDAVITVLITILHVVSTSAAQRDRKQRSQRRRILQTLERLAPWVEIAGALGTLVELISKLL